MAEEDLPAAVGMMVVLSCGWKAAACASIEEALAACCGSIGTGTVAVSSMKEAAS